MVVVGCLCHVVVSRCRREACVFIWRTVERRVVGGWGGAARGCLAEVLVDEGRFVSGWWLAGRSSVEVLVQKGHPSREDVVGKFCLRSCFFRCPGR